MTSGPAKKPLHEKYALIYDLGSKEQTRIDVILIKQTMSLRQLTIQLRAKHDRWREKTIANAQKILQRYKADVIAGNLIAIHKLAAGKQKQEVTVRYKTYEDRKLNPYYLLEEAILVQQERINKLYAQESARPTMLMEQMRKEIVLYSGMLKQLTDLQFDLGLLNRVPKEKKTTLSMVKDGGVEDQAVKQSQKVFEQKGLATHEVFTIMEDLGIKDDYIESTAEEVVYTDNAYEEETEEV